MSYILDALRRAESERARGQVPGLHDQPAMPVALPERQAWPIWAWALLAGLVALMLAAGFWWLRLPPAAEPTGRAANPAVAPPLAATPASMPAALPPVVAAAPMAPSSTPMPAPMPLVVSAPTPMVPPSATPTAAPAPAQTVPPPVIKLADLPADQRREWPSLALGGSVWSESPAQRFVIVNGLLLHEGEAVAPGLVVDRIGAKSLVLRWRERRVEVPL